MNAPQQLDDKTIAGLAITALDKIIASGTPKLLILDPQTLSIRTVSLTARYVNRMADKPTCLGTYDFDAQLEDIIGDLKAVWTHMALMGMDGDSYPLAREQMHAH